MILQFYPEQLESDKEGLVQEFIRKDLKKRNDLRVLVEDFLDKVRKANCLDPFLVAETIEYLAADELFEMRIPKTRSGGVVRIYFCKKPDDDNILILLDAELKKKKKPEKLNRAKERMSIYFKSFCLKG